MTAVPLDPLSQKPAVVQISLSERSYGRGRTTARVWLTRHLELSDKGLDHLIGGLLLAMLDDPPD